MKSLVRRILCGCGLTAVAAVGALAPAAPSANAEGPPDFAAPGEAWNILPPGEEGNPEPKTENAFNQLFMYNGLTPLFDNVSAIETNLPFLFKPNIFGLGGEKPASVVELGPGLTIERDGKGVAHVNGQTRAQVMFGAGVVAVQDRALLMEALRYPGRIAALDVPGVDPFQIALSGRQFLPSAQTEEFLTNEVAALQARPGGQQIVEDVDNYVAGINLARAAAKIPTPEWTRNDVVAVAAIIGARFGVGGGDEARRAEFLSALQQRLGAKDGERVFNDLREENDPEAPVSIPGTFTQRNQENEHVVNNEQGSANAVIDAGSLDGAAAQASASPKQASNALLIGAKRSATGRSLFVAGPQVGYLYPQFLMETDLHGGGIDARGATFPGSGPYVELGRGADFAWSATSSDTDIVDQYAETLCGGSKAKYVFNGKCTDMTTFNAGTLGPGPGPAAGPVVFNETVHGPVSGFATSKGTPVAISTKRSTRGHELNSALGFADFNDNAVNSPQSFIASASKIEFTFNFFYADNKNIAMFSTGLVPIRAQGVNSSLPTVGTGQYEWRGFLPASEHPQAIDPSNEEIINWNNKPAAGWRSADNNWSWGSIQRVQELKNAVARQTTLTLGSVVASMNRAATQDLRDAVVLPPVQAVLKTGPAPSAREQEMLTLLEEWRNEGSSRLDLTDSSGEGNITAPGAAIMDKAWPKIASAVMSPVLGPQLGELQSLIPQDNPANSQGSSYGEGWYGYVDKDLRSLLGLPVEGAFKTQFCGNGNLTACRNSLWNALQEAGNELEKEQGTSDPTKWRKSAIPERIRFGEKFPLTMRWTNRPTFQQAISFSGHR
jgi:acyl-homoserine lactone acylase PvdQ